MKKYKQSPLLTVLLSDLIVNNKRHVEPRPHISNVTIYQKEPKIKFPELEKKTKINTTKQSTAICIAIEQLLSLND